MKNNAVAFVLVALLVGGGVGFFGGMQYQKSQRGSFGPFSARGGSALGRGNVLRGGGVVGDILSVDKNSITVKLPDGSSKIVLLTSSTSINKAGQGAISDLSVGIRVAAFGTTNSDGSVTASNVQINPMQRGPSGASGAQGL